MHMQSNWICGNQLYVTCLWVWGTRLCCCMNHNLHRATCKQFISGFESSQTQRFLNTFSYAYSCNHNHIFCVILSLEYSIWFCAFPSVNFSFCTAFTPLKPQRAVLPAAEVHLLLCQYRAYAWAEFCEPLTEIRRVCTPRCKLKLIQNSLVGAFTQARTSCLFTITQ